MASYTPNYNLKKPAGTDVVDIDDLNGNMDIVDTQLASLNSNLQSLIVDETQFLVYDASGISGAISAPSGLTGYLPFLAVPMESTATDAYILTSPSASYVCCKSISGKSRNTKIYFVKV